jgi:alkanesulfonate monooxygenase SsuD/methylene tetrahydromethanopterin reductase-like flavin-dependent oxidoreductase (luciferase family)
MRLSTVILPLERWPESREKWSRAEELGFYAAYTYDHLSWGRLQDRPWFGAVPTLTAAALATSTMQLGTLVTTPNFRHPVPLAKDLLSLDDMSGGRLIIGIGSGGLGNDATVLGHEEWSAHERMDRFVNFVELLDELLTQPLTTKRHRRSHVAGHTPAAATPLLRGGRGKTRSPHGHSLRAGLGIDRTFRQR